MRGRPGARQLRDASRSKIVDSGPRRCREIEKHICDLLFGWTTRKIRAALTPRWAILGEIQFDAGGRMPWLAHRSAGPIHDAHLRRWYRKAIACGNVQPSSWRTWTSFGGAWGSSISTWLRSIAAWVSAARGRVLRSLNNQLLASPSPHLFAYPNPSGEQRGW
jgi:hypothetical protein